MLRIVQEELASAAGISQRSLAVIETESAKPRAATLLSIRAALEDRGVLFIETDAGCGVILAGSHI